MSELAHDDIRSEEIEPSPIGDEPAGSGNESRVEEPPREQVDQQLGSTALTEVEQPGLERPGLWVNPIADPRYGGFR